MKLNMIGIKIHKKKNLQTFEVFKLFK